MVDLEYQECSAPIFYDRFERQSNILLIVLEIDRFGLGIFFDIVVWILLHVGFDGRIVDGFAENLGDVQVRRLGVLDALRQRILTEFTLDSSERDSERCFSATFPLEAQIRPA